MRRVFYILAILLMVSNPSDGAMKGARSSLLNIPKFEMDFISTKPQWDTGLVRLTISYTGPLMIVRRSSDNTTLTIPPLPNGQLNVGGIMGFVGAGNGSVSQLFDQSGNADNAVEATALNQPQIVTSGVLQTSNNYPILYYNNAGSGQYLFTPFGYNASSVTQFTQNLVFIQPSSASGVNGSRVFSVYNSGDTTDSSTNTSVTLLRPGTGNTTASTRNSGQRSAVTTPIQGNLMTMSSFYDASNVRNDINNGALANTTFSAVGLGTNCCFSLATDVASLTTSNGNVYISQASFFTSALSIADKNNLERLESKIYNIPVP